MPTLRYLLFPLFLAAAWAGAPPTTLPGHWSGSGQFSNAAFQATFGPLPFEFVIAPDLTLTGTVGGARIQACRPTLRPTQADYRAELEGTVRPERAFRKRKLFLRVTRVADATLEAEFELRANFVVDWAKRVGRLEAKRKE